MAVNEAWPANYLDQPAGESGCALRLLLSRLHNRELIAAQPCNHVCRAHAVAQPIGDAFEKTISNRMPQRVIDALESVKINKKDRKRFAAAPNSLQGLIQLLSKQRTVPQAGQGVVVGDVVRLRLGPFTLSYFVSQLLVSTNKLACALSDALLKI